MCKVRCAASACLLEHGVLTGQLKIRHFEQSMLTRVHVELDIASNSLHTSSHIDGGIALLYDKFNTPASPPSHVDVRISV